MKKLILGKQKTFVVLIALVLFAILTVGIISAFWPRYERQFFELSLLGKNKMAEEYFPNNNSTLQPNSTIYWYITINNHFGTPQNVSLRIKLLNSTMVLPNDTDHIPSTVSPFLEIPLSMSANETKLIPFSWSISDAHSQNGSITLAALNVNGQNIQVDVSASNEGFFRIVFELWSFDKSSNQYTFKTTSNNDFTSSSLYIGFRLNIPPD